MEQFIIEIPHSPDECKAAASEIMRHSRAAKVAAGTYWGCPQGTHTTWIMAQLDGATEAGELVPMLLRATARVVRGARGIESTRRQARSERDMRMAPMLTGVAVLVAVAVVAACGGVEQVEEPTTPPATPTSTSATTRVTEEQPEGVEESDEVAAVVEPQTVDVSDGAELVVVAGFFGDPSNNLGGYAVKGEDITSPGPTIRVRKGDSVTITFENDHFYEGGTPFLEAHNFTVVADKDMRVSEMEPLWGAHVGGFGEPNLEAGESASVTLEAEAAGTFYYVCALGDHIGHGMWGQFVVEDAP